MVEKTIKLLLIIGMQLLLSNVPIHFGSFLVLSIVFKIHVSNTNGKIVI